MDTPNAMPAEPQPTFRDYINTRFGGILKSGGHAENGEACILEARNAYLGAAWSDSPDTAQRPDIRALNDAYTDDARRTDAMLRLDEALSWWPDDSARQQRFADLLALATVREIVAELPELPDEIRVMCRAATTLEEATASAESAASAAWNAESAAWRAASAANAANAASAASAARSAARSAAKNDTLDRAVYIWIRYAAESAGEAA